MRIQTKFNELFPNACVIQVFTKKKKKKENKTAWMYTISTVEMAILCELQMPSGHVC